jgi:hypothetical protein
VGGEYILAILPGCLLSALCFLNERKVDVLIRKKKMIVTILLASIDLFEPGNTCVESAVDLRANDFQCVEVGRLVTCSMSPSRDERTADHHNSN